MFKRFLDYFKDENEGGENTPTPRSPFIEIIIALGIWIFGGLTVMWFLFEMLPFMVHWIGMIQDGKW